MRLGESKRYAEALHLDTAAESETRKHIALVGAHVGACLVVVA